MKSMQSAAIWFVGVGMLLLFAYGAGRFHDGPISECGSGYCSTHRQPHTAEDYRAFKVWEKTIWIVWPLGLGALFLLQRAKRPD